MPRGAARAREFLEIAKLATERVKKPEVCIELWNEVIESDPENAEALNALAGLHERAKDWTALAERAREAGRARPTTRAARSRLLGKLGALYGERLNNDEARGRGVAQLLALNPQDRKARRRSRRST